MNILLVQPYALGSGHYDGYTKRMCEGFCQLGLPVTLITAAGTNSNWENQLPINHLAASNKDSRLIVNLSAAAYTSKFANRIVRRLRFVYTSWVVGKKSFQLFSNKEHDILHFVDCEPIVLAVLFWFFKKPANVFLTVRVPYTIYKKSFWRYTYDPVRRFAVRRLFRSISVITHSEPVKKSLLEHHMVLGNGVRVITLGVDSVLAPCNKNDSRKVLNIADDKKVFGFFGNLIFHKGFDLALETWCLMQSNFILLALVHTDNPEEEKRIKEYITRNGSLDKKSIIKFGYATEQELALNISACDAIILPYRKTFQGDSGIMSLACSYKIPLIASDCGLIGGALKTYNLGILFEPESVQAFKAAIESFATMDAGSISAIQRSMAAYQEAHSWREFARQHTMYYQEIEHG